MALATYSDLLTQVPLWAMRSGDEEFEDAVPVMVQQLEHTLNNGAEGVPALRVREMETAAPVTLTEGVGNLPDDYLEYIEVLDGQGRALDPVVETYASQAYRLSGGGQARTFSIVGNEIKTWPRVTGDLTLRYYAKVPALSEDNSTNWLLSKDSRIYLYGTLLQGSSFMLDPGQLNTWASLFSQALAGLVNSDRRSKYVRATVRVRGANP